ncbi:MAG: hypothetical protein IJQ80_07805, partial [Clostridia bacterium]|nr:hypothetical protein [Clostridia bacterium]
MRHSQATRLFALFLALMTLIGPVSARAADEEETAADTGTLRSTSDSLVFISYENYLTKVLGDFEDDSNSGGMTAEEKKAAALDEARATDTYTYPATENYEADEIAGCKVENHLGYDALYISDEGLVTWTIDVPKAGFYTISFDYCPTYKVTDSGQEDIRYANIEKIFYLNGKVPFQETRYLAMNKLWN